MFHTRSIGFFLFINFALGCFFFFLFHSFGWFTYSDTYPFPVVAAGVGLLNIFIGFLSHVVRFLLKPISKIFGCCTLGFINIIIAIFSVYIILWATAYFTHIFTIAAPIWSWYNISSLSIPFLSQATLLISILFGLIRFRFENDHKNK